MLCVECGAEAPGLIDGSCATCFAEKHRLLDSPDVLDLELCSHCGARRVGSHWHDVEPDTPEEWTREEAIRDVLGVHEAVEAPLLDVVQDQQDEKHYGVQVDMEGHIGDVEVTASRELTLRRRNGVCDRCSRIAGGYYAAIIQLRATDRDVTSDELERAHAVTAQDLSRQLNGGNRFAFIAKEGEMHGGWDYYVGDIDAARNVCRVLKTRLGAIVSETAKLVGRREGNDVYRVTFLVRIRPFSPGDLLVHEERPYAVIGVHPTSLSVQRLDDHRRDRVDEAHSKRLGGPEILEEATIVSQAGQDVDVVDPATFRTVTVRVPDGWEPSADTLWVLRHEEALFWVPAPNKS